MPNPFAGPKIALLCSLFNEYMIHYNSTLQNIMLYHTQTKIFEYGQKYLTAFIIMFPYFELVDGLGKSLNFEFRIRKGKKIEKQINKKSSIALIDSLHVTS